MKEDSKKENLRGKGPKSPYLNADITYCRSKNCKNECGRAFPENYNELIEEYLSKHGMYPQLWTAYFCENKEGNNI